MEAETPVANENERLVRGLLLHKTGTRTVPILNKCADCSLQ
jgi:hypothetical protein